MYQCDNGKCISSSLYCDFENHCGDNSDEIYCGKCYKMLVTFANKKAFQ